METAPANVSLSSLVAEDVVNMLAVNAARG